MVDETDLKSMAPSTRTLNREQAEADQEALTKVNGHARRRLNREPQFMFRCSPPERRMLEELADRMGRATFNETLVQGLHALKEKLDAVA